MKGVQKLSDYINVACCVALSGTHVLKCRVEGEHLDRCCFHHSATAPGYVSRKADENGNTGYVEPYCGRYGRGYRYHYPKWDSTQYHGVDYWIYEED